MNHRTSWRQLRNQKPCRPCVECGTKVRVGAGFRGRYCSSCYRARS